MSGATFSAAPPGWRAVYEVADAEGAPAGARIELPVVGWLADYDDHAPWVAGVVSSQGATTGTAVAHALPRFVGFLGPGEEL